jgi:hypothetical protein
MDEVFACLIYTRKMAGVWDQVSTILRGGSKGNVGIEVPVFKP